MTTEPKKPFTCTCPRCGYDGIMPGAIVGARGGSRHSPAQQAALARGRKMGGWPLGRKRGPRKPKVEPVAQETAAETTGA
jgi:hypothetical protein